MNDNFILENVHAQANAHKTEGRVVLWTESDPQDDTHVARLDALTRVLDVCVGGTLHIDGIAWRLQENFLGKGKGVEVVLVRADGTRSGMVATDRPRTKAEWNEWGRRKLQAAGITPTPSQPPKESHEIYTASFEGWREAEA